MVGKLEPYRDEQPTPALYKIGLDAFSSMSEGATHGFYNSINGLGKRARNNIMRKLHVRETGLKVEAEELFVQFKIRGLPVKASDKG